MEADDDLVPGGIYAVQGQEGGPYWLAKVIYTEEQIVHVICYAEYMNNLAQDILEQELTVGLKREDSSFGSPHLPIPKAHFAANTILIGQRPLTDSDFRGYRIYVDSVFDCLDEQAPDWLKRLAPMQLGAMTIRQWLPLWIAILLGLICSETVENRFTGSTDLSM